LAVPVLNTSPSTRLLAETGNRNQGTSIIYFGKPRPGNRLYNNCPDFFFEKNWILGLFYPMPNLEQLIVLNKLAGHWLLKKFGFWAYSKPTIQHKTAHYAYYIPMTKLKTAHWDYSTPMTQLETAHWAYSTTITQLKTGHWAYSTRA
jgi:hypothetical protein